MKALGEVVAAIEGRCVRAHVSGDIERTEGRTRRRRNVRGMAGVWLRCCICSRQNVEMREAHD